MTGIQNITAEKREHEKTWPQIVVILISALAGISNGLIYSWSSPFLVKITADKENYDITEEEGSYFITIQPIAMLLFAPIFSKLLDVIGRKKTLLLITVPQIGSWICAGFARSVYVFYVARILAGIADSCFYATLPIYVGEIATPVIRGTWGNLVATSYYIGEFLINVIGSYFNVRQTSYICLPLPILFFVLFSLMPESPYYYLMRDQEENAKKSLIFLKRTKNIEASFTQLKADVKRQMSESGTWSDLFKIESNRKALLAAAFVRFSQVNSGMIVFITYTQFIFQKSGGNISHEVSSIIFMGLQICLNFFVLAFVVNRFGRRILYLTSMCTSAGIQYIMAVYYYIDDNTDVDLSNFRWFPIGSMVMFQIFSSFGIFVIPTLMLSELFSASIKAKATMFLLALFGTGCFMTVYIFYSINIFFGFYAPFLLFAVFNTISTVISYYIIPETRNKTLEEIQQSLKGNK